MCLTERRHDAAVCGQRGFAIRERFVYVTAAFDSTGRSGDPLKRRTGPAFGDAETPLVPIPSPGSVCWRPSDTGGVSEHATSAHLCHGIARGGSASHHGQYSMAVQRKGGQILYRNDDC